MQLPSNRVGFVLVFVVLCVASTIFFSKIGTKGSLKDLQNVDLVIARNTDTIQKSGDGDLDGLSDWQEELWRTDPDVPDTDGDGTNDGDEIAANRDPKIPGPKDVLVQPSDYFQSEVDFSNFATGTKSDRLSIDLFSKYLNLKMKGDISEEDKTKLADNVAQNIASSAVLKDLYGVSDFTIVVSNVESVKSYGTEFADISLNYLDQINASKSLSDEQYLTRVSGLYKEMASALAGMDVPDVTKDVHVRIVNQTYKTGSVFEAMIESEKDPVTALMVVGQYQASMQDDLALYTSLAQYFKNNGIIFDSTAATNFWKYFE